MTVAFPASPLGIRGFFFALRLATIGLHLSPGDVKKLMKFIQQWKPWFFFNQERSFSRFYNVPKAAATPLLQACVIKGGYGQFPALSSIVFMGVQKRPVGKILCVCVKFPVSVSPRLSYMIVLFHTCPSAVP